MKIPIETLAKKLLDFGGWTKLPYKNIFYVDPNIWKKFIELHCDGNAIKNAELGLFAGGIIIVGKIKALKHIKKWCKILKQVTNNPNKTHKIILRLRIKSLRFETKYFSPKLP